MKAPSFAYAKPRSLEEVFVLLRAHRRREAARRRPEPARDAQHAALLARRPGRHHGAAGARRHRGPRRNVLRIGALTRHARDRALARRSPSTRRCSRRPRRTSRTPRSATRGTFGGSLAHADPAAEWPACCVALDADFVIASRAGERRVKARDFFKGLFETALGAGELIAAVEFPLLGAGYRSAFLELARRRGDYAIVGVAAAARPAGGALADVRLAFLGAGATPILARNAMAAAEGKQRSPGAIAAAQARSTKTSRRSATSTLRRATKLHLARVLCGARARAARCLGRRRWKRPSRRRSPSTAPR